MARRSKDSDLRVGGLSVAARFTLFTMLALAPILALSGYLLYDKTRAITESVLDDTLAEAVRIRAEEEAYMARYNEARTLYDRRKREYDELRKEHAAQLEQQKLPAVRKDLKERFAEEEAAAYQEITELFDELRRVKSQFWLQREEDKTVRNLAGGIRMLRVSYGAQKDRYGLAYLYEHEGKRTSLVVPDTAGEAGRGILGLILGITLAVTLVAAGVAAWVGGQVSRPIQRIVGDIRQIAVGNFGHKSHVRGGGEIALLARAINRMSDDLSEAQNTELELQVREREVEVAAEVRESLRARSAPQIEGYDLGVMHLPSGEMSGDFYDFLRLEDGRVGLLVCDVSGQGVPGTLIGATARAYLRSELSRGGDVREAFMTINRMLARDVRSGMYVTALYVLVDPSQAAGEVYCAGHKIPLVRFTKSDGKVRTIQPEGIALGFDPGPIFDRALTAQKITLEPGDRLVMANTGAVEIPDPDGQELGERQFYAKVQRHGGRASKEFLERLQTVLESWLDGGELPRDVSVITIARLS